MELFALQRLPQVLDVVAAHDPEHAERTQALGAKAHGTRMCLRRVVHPADPGDVARVPERVDRLGADAEAVHERVRWGLGPAHRGHGGQASIVYLRAETLPALLRVMRTISPRVVSSLALFILAACGAATSASVREESSAPDVARTRVDLLERVNAERASKGLAPLEADPMLDRIALAHSEDMRDAHFVGHDSPTTGTPADRVERAGLGRMAVLENVARGIDTEALWTSFQTLSQRENMLNAQSTHTGIGIAIERTEDGWLLLATQVFVQLAREIDVAAAPAKVRAIVDEARRKRSLATLRGDPKLDEVATQAAREFFEGPSSEADIVGRANQRLAPLGATYRKVGTVTALVRVLEESVGLEPSLDAEAKALGIGVAQGERAGAGPHAIAVVLIWAK